MAGPATDADDKAKARAIKRERDRRGRERRAANVEAMRNEVISLERALPVMLTLEAEGAAKDDVEWEGFLDEKALRVRRVMRKSLQLAREAESLRAEKWHLAQLLWEHRVASRVLAGLVAAQQEDEWDTNVARWCRLTRENLPPWPRAACQAEAARALREMDALLNSNQTESSGVSFLGWRDRRRTDPVTHSLEYVFDKAFPGFDMMDFVEKTWGVYTNADAYQYVIMGENTRSYVDVVQEISPTMCIVRFDERYPSVDKDAHMLLLVLQVETERGFVHCMRSIDAPEVQRAFEGPHDSWAFNSVWLKWDALDREDPSGGYRMYAGGAIACDDVAYASRWLVEILVSLIRGESWITRRELLKNGPPTSAP